MGAGLGTGIESGEHSMEPFINIAIQAARKAGEVILRASRHLPTVQVESKGRHDFVTDVDRRAEALIVEIIGKAYPDHAILAEEGGAAGQHEVTWIIDPLDGTTNFIHGFPHYAVSIGVRIKDQLAHGVIYDPLRDELFTASRGRGAALDGRRIRVAQRPRLEGALMGTGIPFRESDHSAAYFAMLQAVAQRSAGIRRAGSAALDLAYVAAGRLDGFWEFGLAPWDLAAGVLLIQEAGGYVGGLTGEPLQLEQGDVVAANPKLFAELIQSMAAHVTEALHRRNGSPGT